MPARVALATVFVGATLFIIQHNVRETIRNPDLGTRYVNVRLADLMREVEGIDPPTRQGMANIFLGDGMRFVAFLAENLPEGTTAVIFPTDERGSWTPPEYFSSAGYNHFKPLLHPREIQTEVYDFQKLPYDPSLPTGVPTGYRVITRDYSHSSRHWVM